MRHRFPSGAPKAKGARAARGKPLGEFERIARIAKLFATTAGHRQVKVGIGDDAAVLRLGKGELVWTVDSSVEAVHFRRSWLQLEDVGWRSFHAAASDLAAMGATPLAALSALELPPTLDDTNLARLLRGQAEAANSLRCPIVGGNLAAAAAVSVCTTLIGKVSRPLLRSGAQIGDEVWLVGQVGLAAAGLACLMQNLSTSRDDAAEHCVSAWRRPTALIARGRSLVGRAHAAIDISDGLVGDARHIATSSRVAVDIDLDMLCDLLSPDLQRVAERLHRPAIDLALYGGEDYALLATGQAAKRPRWAIAVGRVTDGAGVWGISKGTGRRRLGRGFEHFGG